MRHLKDHLTGPKGHYPGGRFHEAGEREIDVYDKSGRQVLALRKDGADMWTDQSAAHGLPGRLDLSAPKAGQQVQAPAQDAGAIDWPPKNI